MTGSEHECDYRQAVTGVTGGEFLPNSNIEIIKDPEGRGEFKHALFDFDGTLSLIRAGWPEVMVPMMVEILVQVDPDDTRERIEEVVREFVGDLTGKQTIYQMIRFAEEIEKRGGKAEDPMVYKQMYLDGLMEMIRDRREALRSKQVDPRDMMVPGSLDLVKGLIEKGVQVYLASGTDEPFVKEEADLLGLTPYFGDHVYGALDDYKSFSKQMVIDRILRENRIEGKCLLGFGDGFVEIDNIKCSGGTAIGVATDEENRSGIPDEWKRKRLIGVGADVIIPDYSQAARLLRYLFP